MKLKLKAIQHSIKTKTKSTSTPLATITKLQLKV